MKLRYVPLEPMENLEVAQSEYHALWHDLHTQVRTADQFADWVKRVPNFGCGCQSWLKDYLAKNDFSNGDLAEYGWRLHNAVNAKLRDEGKDRPEFSWAEFENKYGSHTDGNQDSG